MPKLTLDDLEFSDLPPTWKETKRLAAAVFPDAGMTAEQSYNLHMAKNLLSVLLLAVLRRQRPTLRYVRLLVSEMDEHPAERARELVDTEIDETRYVLETVLKSIGALYSEPIKMLLINIKEKHTQRPGEKWQNVSFADRQNSVL